MKDILFFSTYTRKVDSKGRISIPVEWRKNFNNNTVFIFRTEMFPQKLDCEFLDIFIGFTDINQWIKKHGGDCRTEHILAFIKQYNFDKEGRIVLKDSRGLVATLKGRGNYFTIEFRDS